MSESLRLTIVCLATVVACVCTTAVLFAPPALGKQPDQTARTYSPRAALFNCYEGGPSFRRSALARRTGVELRRNAAARALRAYLDPPGSTTPRRGWRELRRDKTLVVFGHPGRRGGRGAKVTVEIERRKGRWRKTVEEGCSPTRVVEGLLAVGWGLERSYGQRTRVKPGSRELRLFFGRGACQFVDHVEVRESRRSVMVLLLLRDAVLPPGGHCTDNIVYDSVRVTLPSQIGRRALRDMSSAPQRTIRDLRPSARRRR